MSAEPHEPRPTEPAPQEGLAPTVPARGVRPESAPTVPARGRRAGPAGPRQDLTGQVLGGKYRVLRLIGEGGFGSVYEAVDEMLGAHVAVKVLTPQASTRHDALQRFLGEARLLTSLDHPNVVRWITFDRTPSGLHYFVMEFLRGKELSDVLAEQGRLPPPRVIAILLQVLSALRAAHFLPDGRALLHLDLKPRNVFVCDGEEEMVKVIDFGISQHVGAVVRARADAPGERAAASADLAATVSGAGGVAASGGHAVQRAAGGTLLYASPEQVLHLIGAPDIVELDGRSDLYSLGVMAFELLAGRLPWTCTTSQDAVRAQLELPPERLAALGVKLPRGLEQFVARCLAKDRTQRFVDVRAAYDALWRVANPKARWPLVAAVLVLLAAVATWLSWPAPKPDVLEVAAPDATVFLSPARPSAALRLGNLLPALRGAPARWVADRQADADALPTWRTALVEADGEVRAEVHAPGSAALFDRQPLYLRVGEGAGAQFSAPLRVVYVPADAWDIAEVAVRGAGQRAIDPLGARLHIGLRVPDNAYIESVKVSCGATVCNAMRDPTVGDGTHPLYTLAVTDLGVDASAAEQAIAVAVLARDHAGNEHRSELALRLDARPLTLDAELIGCLAQSPGSYVVYRGDRPTLRWTSNRDVAIEVAARDARNTLLALTQEPRDGGIALQLPARDVAYAAELEVTATDDKAVLHSDPARGRAACTLRVRYETRAVGVTPRLLAPDGAELPRGVAGAKDCWLVAGESFRMEISRPLEVPLVVVIEQSGALGPATPREVELHDVARAAEEFVFGSAGRATFTLSAFRYVGPGVERPRNPEFRAEVMVLRDGQAPTLSVARAPEAVLRALRADDPCVEVRAGDDVDEPVQVSWTLRGAGGPRNGVVAPGRTAVTWDDLGLLDPAAGDGTYELSLAARDAAGNTSPALAPVTFTLARSGPRVVLTTPADPTWLPRAGNAFVVGASVADENGVRAVACRLTAAGAGPELSLIQPLAAAGDHPDAARWSGEFVLPAPWSGRRVQVACSATDRYGNTTEAPAFATVLPAFEVQRAPKIFLQLSDSPVSSQPMRFVRGDPRYVSGVRDDDAEVLAGIGFTTKLPTSSRPEVVEDFYLDENEVTVADFLAFVCDEAGYAQPAYWEQSAPNGPRRHELEQQLRGCDGALPVTGIDWHEASAYARFAGKRLPTAVEWEYAVRGGTEYRACSCMGPGFRSADLNVLRAGNEGAPWSIDRGVDVVVGGVGEGLRNLCSNVAEWTSTEFRDRRRMVVGASFQHERFHFAVQEPRQPGVRLPSVGLRCAASASAIDAVVERPGRVRVVLTQPPANGR
jgi:serine/threonine protein kinase